MKAKIRLLVIVDSSLKKEKILDILKRLSFDYKTDNLILTWDFESQDFSDKKWVSYKCYGCKNCLGLDFTFINEIADRTNRVHKEKYDCLCLVLDEKNWRMTDDCKAYGWNLGRFFKNYQVQLIKMDDKWLYETFAMEIFHAMDNFVFKELGVNLSHVLNVSDFDEEIVHKYAFNYRLWILKIEKQLIECFELRNKNYNKWKRIEIIRLMKLVVSLYRKLILHYQKPKPIYEIFKRSKK